MDWAAAAISIFWGVRSAQAWAPWIVVIGAMAATASAIYLLIQGGWWGVGLSAACALGGLVFRSSREDRLFKPEQFTFYVLFAVIAAIAAWAIPA